MAGLSFREECPQIRPMGLANSSGPVCGTEMQGAVAFINAGQPRPSIRPGEAPARCPPHWSIACRLRHHFPGQIAIDNRSLSFTVWSSSLQEGHDVEPEGMGVEYVLIGSIALLIGFCLGVLVMRLLDAFDPDEPPRRTPADAHDAAPSRR